MIPIDLSRNAVTTLVAELVAIGRTKHLKILNIMKDTTQATNMNSFV